MKKLITTKQAWILQMKITFSLPHRVFITAALEHSLYIINKSNNILEVGKL